MSEFPFRGSIGLVGKVLQEVDDSHLDIEFFHEPKYRGAVPSAVLGDLRVLPCARTGQGHGETLFVITS